LTEVIRYTSFTIALVVRIIVTDDALNHLFQTNTTAKHHFLLSPEALDGVRPSGQEESKMDSKRICELTEIWSKDLVELHNQRRDKPLPERLKINAQVFCEIVRRLRHRVETEPYFEKYNKMSDYIVSDLRNTTLHSHIEYRLEKITELATHPKAILEQILEWAIRYLSVRVDRMCLLMTLIELDCFVDFVYFLMWTNIHTL